VLFDGRDLMGLSEEQMRRVRGGDIGMVFQEPNDFAEPGVTIGRQSPKPWSSIAAWIWAAADRRAVESAGPRRHCRCQSAAEPITRINCPAACASAS